VALPGPRLGPRGACGLGGSAGNEDLRDDVGDGPQKTDSGEIGSPFQGGRTINFRNADDHIFEFMTVPQTGAT
jgi:hypothetical protein